MYLYPRMNIEEPLEQWTLVLPVPCTGKRATYRSMIILAPK